MAIQAQAKRKIYQISGLNISAISMEKLNIEKHIISEIASLLNDQSLDILCLKVNIS